MGAFIFWLSASLLIDRLLVLHPRHKLEYFKKNRWHDSWIKAAYDIIHKEFNRSYPLMGNMSEGDNMEESSDDKVSLCVAFWSLCLLH
jgi:hypothetical protein